MFGPDVDATADESVAASVVAVESVVDAESGVTDAAGAVDVGAPLEEVDLSSSPHAASNSSETAASTARFLPTRLLGESCVVWREVCMSARFPCRVMPLDHSQRVPRCCHRGALPLASATMTPEAPHPRLVAALIGVGLAVALVSGVGAPMVPTVANDYGITLAAAQWTLTIALLCGSVVVPVLGRLGDGPRRREVMIATLATVFAGSLIAGIPGPFWMLLVGRGMQGMGLGLMPMSMAVVRDHLPAARTRQAIAALSITTSAGVGVGYPLSGLLAESIGFHGTHLIVAGVVAGVLIVALRTVPAGRHLAPRRVDLLSSALLAAGVATLVIASAESSAWGVGSAAILGLVGAAIVLLSLWAWRELRSPNPLIQLRTLRYPSVRTAQSGAVLAGIAMFFTFALVIRFVQTPTSTGYGLGGSVLVAGLLLVPFSAASFGIHRLLPVLFRAMPSYWLMALGAAVSGLSLGVFTISRGSLWELTIVTTINGAGSGMVFAALPLLVVGIVPAHETGATLGFNQVSRTVGGAIGSAASGAVLAAYTSGRFPTNHGYTVAGLIGIGVWSVALLVSIPRRALRTAFR